MFDFALYVYRVFLSDQSCFEAWGRLFIVMIECPSTEQLVKTDWADEPRLSRLLFQISFYKLWEE